LRYCDLVLFSTREHYEYYTHHINIHIYYPFHWRFIPLLHKGGIYKTLFRKGPVFNINIWENNFRVIYQKNGAVEKRQRLRWLDQQPDRQWGIIFIRLFPTV